MPSVSVPYVVPDWGRKAPDHDKNLAHFEKIIAERLAEARRVMSARAVSWRMDVANQAHMAWGAYAKFFGIRRKAPDTCLDAWAAALDRAKSIEQPDPVRDAKRFKAQERRKTAKRAELQAAYDAHCEAVRVYNAAVIEARNAASIIDAAQVWRDTGRWPSVDQSGLPRMPYLGYKAERQLRSIFDMPERESWHSDARSGVVLLRVNGEQIETSQGARIPLDHAPRIWRFVKAVIARGEAYQRNGHTEHAGEFAIDRIEADGTMKAGCHVIPYAEIERMARTLGYIPAEHASAQGG
jgi:hypothetical protein